MKTKLHDLIRARRLALRLSQVEVARRSGIQQRQVSTFERGGDVTLSTLAKLTQALDMELVPFRGKAPQRLKPFSEHNINHQPPLPHHPCSIATG
jgi:transcriptional regulator with XRE-family HTH domain